VDYFMAQKRVKHNGNALLDKAYRYESNGWVFVHVEGQPFERGYQHGYLLAREIQDALRVSKFLAHWDTGEDFEVFVKAALQLFPARVDQEYLDEMQGIAQGARMAGIDISFDEILTWNGYQELLGNWWPNNMGSIPSTKRWKGKKGHHCSAFIATGKHTKDGRIVMAHNTWDRYASGDHYNIILDILPASGNRILMQAVPGYISSTTDFWETSAGLMITETTIAGISSFDATKAPEFYRSRKASQYAKSIEEWVQIFSTENNGGYANSWLLGDIKTGEIARFEMGLKFSGLEKTKDGYYGGFNTPANLKIRNQECDGEGEEYSDIRKNGSRRLRWMQLMNERQGNVDVENAKAMIADHYDVYLKQKNNPCSRTICGHLELDKAEYGSHDDQGPYYPWGANDGKVTDGEMTKAMSLWARWGHSCGLPFDAKAFLTENPQYDWLDSYMKDRPSYPWTQFSSMKDQPRKSRPAIRKT